MNLHIGQHPSSCGNCQIRHRAVCSRCDSDELAVLDRIKTYRSFDAGQPIVWAGEEADFLGSVVSGVAALTQTMEDGRRQMVGLLQPSDFVGRPGRKLAAFDVTAVTEVVLCCFQRRPFEDLILHTPNVAQRLLEMTLDELDAAREWMLLLGRKTAREKIASLLAILARRSAMLGVGKARREMTFALPLTREAMADYLGLTLETVSRQISALKKDGVIRLDGNRGVTVPDYDRLLEETGDDADGGALT
jgi:CRP/FNR family transcriptional regulator